MRLYLLQAFTHTVASSVLWMAQLLHTQPSTTTSGSDPSATVSSPLTLMGLEISRRSKPPLILSQLIIRRTFSFRLVPEITCNHILHWSHSFCAIVAWFVQFCFVFSFSFFLYFLFLFFFKVFKEKWSEGEDFNQLSLFNVHEAKS